jgi:biotin transporter BioY
MNLSVFLAKSIGFYYVFISFAFVINKIRLKPIMRDIINNPSLILLSGFIALILGILMVVSHSVWVKDWRVIITIASWLVLMKGMTIMLFPESLVSMSLKWMQNNVAYYAAFLFVFLLGVILLCFGFYHRQ